jgi:hypothetical protein
VLATGAARIKGINETTRAGINALVQQGLDEGWGAAELGDAIEAWSGFDEYRAELIARTELGTAYNAAALGSYRENGVEYVQVTDGDQDDECAPWSDWTGPIEDAPDELGHPNCTRDFIPVIGEYADEGKATIERPSMKVDKAVEFLQGIADDEKASRAEMVGMVTALTEAMKAQASQPITVNYHPPEIHVPPAVVNMPAPIVNIAAPEVKGIRKIVKRDEDGNITEVREEVV